MINWKVRIKNPYFWIGLIGVIFTAMGVSPDMFTSWDALFGQFKILFSNPFMLGGVIFAVLGVICDPTTEGRSEERRVGKECED